MQNILKALIGIYRKSFQEGSVSYSMKVPKVISILKSGDNSILSSYID